MKLFRNGLIPKPIALLRYRTSRGSGGVVTEGRCSAEVRCCCSWAALERAPGATIQAELAVAATAQQSRAFVPDVRVATVRASDRKITVTLPATTDGI